MQLLRTILIILLVYYGLKFLSRLFGPILLKFVAKKAEQKFTQQYGQRPGQEVKRPPEGEVTIDKNSKSDKKPTNTVGDYIDYEEIE